MPNPDCKYCRGTGKIQLLTSMVDCDCIKENSDEEIKIEIPPNTFTSETIVSPDAWPLMPPLSAGEIPDRSVEEWTFAVDKDGNVHATINGVATDPWIAFSLLPASIVFGSVATCIDAPIDCIVPESGSYVNITYTI
jgi:hypothetical protein